MSDDANQHAGIPQVKDRFDEIFEVEIDGWCYGLTHFPGEVHAALVHRVIKELATPFKEAIEHNYVFNVLDLSTRISRAAKYLVPEREIAFAILYQIPSPAEFSDDGKFVVAQIIDQVEQAYTGALDKVQKKWLWEAEKGKPKQAA